MTDSERPLDDDGPVTYRDIARRRGKRPVKELPRLILSAVRLVRRAAPREFRTIIAASVAGGVLVALQLLFVQRLLAGVVDVAEREDIVDLLPWMLGFVATFTAIGVIGVFQGERRRVLSELVAAHSQAVVASAAADADLVDFDRPAFHNRLQRALANASFRPVSLTYALITVTSAGLTVGGVMVGLLIIQPVMLLLVLVTIGPVWLGTKRITRLGYLFDLEETEADRRRSYFLHLLTDKRAAKELRAYQLSGSFTTQHRELWDGRIERVRNLASKRLRIGLVSRLVNSVLLALVLLLLVWMVVDGRVSVSDAAVVAAAIVILGQRLSAMVSSIGELYESSLFLRDVETFLEDSQLQHLRRGTIVLEHEFEEVRVDDVTFTYPAGATDALRGVSMHVRRGEVVALVGANGSGKTTLAKLIAQLYQPATGTVTWNGVDTSTLAPEALRDQVAVIFQDFERYHFTAGENIAFGRIDRSDDGEAIRAAAERASALEFIEALSQGFDSLLGPEFIGGHDLSVGQWQRLAIARAFFRDAGLIVLDEPSSALDPDAEALLFDNIRDLCRGRAVVIISHRFSTVTSADRIYVLDHGRVVDEGSHRELMDAGGEYARMFAVQADRYLDPS